jgi:ABC-type antimicrobial peptide transport system permease subunit
VGIVPDVRSSYTSVAHPSLYVPLSSERVRTIMFVARVAPGAKLLVSDVRSLIQAAGVDVTTVSIRSVAAGLEAGLGDQKFRAVLFSVFGATALLLAALGLYAVAAYEVAQRRHEIGIRMAVGASGADVQRLIVRQALVPVLVGTLIGVAGTYWAGASIQSFLYQVDARDLGTLVLVALVLFASTAMAAWIPAHRAARLDPAAVLRAP